MENFSIEPKSFLAPFFLSAIVAVSSVFGAWDPVFNTGEQISIGGQLIKDLPINVYNQTPALFNGMTTPTFVDLNKDGIEDLVTGLFDNGQILYSINTGTKTEPAFDEYSFFETDGQLSFAFPI